MDLFQDGKLKAGRDSLLLSKWGFHCCSDLCQFQVTGNRVREVHRQQAASLLRTGLEHAYIPSTHIPCLEHDLMSYSELKKNEKKTITRTTKSTQTNTRKYCFW